MTEADWHTLLDAVGVRSQEKGDRPSAPGPGEWGEEVEVLRGWSLWLRDEEGAGGVEWALGQGRTPHREAGKFFWHRLHPRADDLPANGLPARLFPRMPGAPRGQSYSLPVPLRRLAGVPGRLEEVEGQADTAPQGEGLSRCRAIARPADTCGRPGRPPLRPPVGGRTRQRAAQERERACGRH